MSKTDPYVRELLRKNQYAEALRYYRTRYNAERPEAMRVLQEIQAELSGKPPAGVIVNSSGSPIQSSQTQTPAKETPLADFKIVQNKIVEQPAPPEPPRPAPTPPKPAPAPEPPKPAPAPVVSAPVSYQSIPKVDPAAIRSDSYWNNLSLGLRSEIQSLLEDDRPLDAIRTYWRESPIELRDAKERVLRWAASFPPKR
jgi:hypothetical protein